jgi:hypothetical protein
MKGIVDRHFFYDDQSDDGTEKLAEIAGCEVFVRLDSAPSFMEDEGAFRGDAWKAFEYVMEPQDGDWVLVIDCDEVLVSYYSSEPLSVRETVDQAIRDARSPLMLEIPEVFGFGESEPLVRIDRLWGTIHAPRLFPYRPHGQYYQGGLGSPAVPSYAMMSHTPCDTLAIMHYGYASEEDQLAKYGRYGSREGHSNAHVESIVAPDKTLTPWKWPYVEEMRTWKRST